MPGFRELLTVVLGVLLGIACVVFPEAVARLSVFWGGGAGGPTQSPDEEYGADASLSNRGRRLVQVLGLACIAAAAVVAWQAYG